MESLLYISARLILEKHMSDGLNKNINRNYKVITINSYYFSKTNLVNRMKLQMSLI